VKSDEIVEDGKIDGATNIPLGQLIRNARQDKLNDLKGKTIPIATAAIVET